MSGELQTEVENIMEIVKQAKRGLLVVGRLHTAEETWAAVMLASHLGWPVFPDVLSGLRIGDVFINTSNVIQHVDQILLSKPVADSIQPDVILQVLVNHVQPLVDSWYPTFFDSEWNYTYTGALLENGNSQVLLM